MAEMRAGSTARAELLAGDGPVLEVRDFSATSVDQLSGNFGMEIRVGYEIGTGGPVPVTGGSVTGNLFEALANARFSSETVQFARLAGPAAIRFESLQVAGAD